MKPDQYIPQTSIAVIHKNYPAPKDAIQCIVDQDISFETEGLQCYFGRDSKPIAYDCLILTAAIEFADHVKKRPVKGWARDFTISVPVHDPDHWNSESLNGALVDALEFLTGDYWQIKFIQTPNPVKLEGQKYLELPSVIEAVLPFSDGLDSRAVSQIEGSRLGEKLVRVRVGRKQKDRPSKEGRLHPFTVLPFNVSLSGRANTESSGRSRGFKFAMICGLAAHIIDAKTVIVPESAQGAIGPTLVNVGHGHPDRRTHPEFTKKMSVLLNAVFDQKICFSHPTIWDTKGETLKAYSKIDPSDESWRETVSCWHDPRNASVNGRYHQCGICAACMLRRLSLHSAGLEEEDGTYIWDNLDTEEFWNGANSDFVHRHGSFRDYAIAGVLHLDHMANLLGKPQYDPMIRKQAMQLSKALNIPLDEANNNLRRFLTQHKKEWTAFMANRSQKSFLREWAQLI